MKILGIDPGTATTGFGLLKKQGKDVFCIDYGIIVTSNDFSAQERLRQLYNEINLIIRRHQPDILAIERLYFFKNAKTVMTVSQAKGVILLAGARKKLSVYEFSPLEIKTSVTGYGRAKKSQIQKMIKTHLQMERIPKPDDAADALAVAFCCARSMK